MPTVAVFIDGDSLKIASRALYGSAPDHKALAVMIARRWQHTLGPIYYYDSPASNPAALPAQERFWQIQESIGITVRVGRTEHRGNGRYRQKEVDVMIACDMLAAAYEKSFDRIALVSGDTDYAYAIECATELGMEVGWVYLRSQGHVDRLRNLIPAERQLLIDDKTFRAIRQQRSRQPAPRY